MISNRIAVENHGAKFRPWIWGKLAKEIEDKGIRTLFTGIIDRCKATADGGFTRGDAFRLAEGDDVAASLIAMVWGFPTGTAGPAGLKQTLSALNNAGYFGGRLTKLKQQQLAAKDALVSLDGIPGVGYARTSKMLYFAGVQLAEGQALIFDSKILNAIRSGRSRIAFDKTRKALGSGLTKRQVFDAYGYFVQEAAAAALLENCTPAQIEMSVFTDEASVSSRKSQWQIYPR